MNALLKSKWLKAIPSFGTDRPSFETVLIAAVVVLALAATIWFVLRRRRKAAAAAAESPAIESGPDKSAGDALARTWQQFVRALPGRARRSLDQFQPVVVLGTESAGKAELIERFSGVNQRYAEIGRPAQLTDGDLRLYLGGQILVMELSEEACCARMDTVGGGLRRAFGPVLRRHTPIVVVCLSPESLEKLAEQDLRELGGALSAKIALLADLRGEEVEVRVVVPAGPGAQVLRALFLLTQLPGVSPVLPLGLGEEPAIRAQLLAFTDLLTQVLATRSADETLGVVELLAAVPRLSQSLSAFVSELFDGGAGGRIRGGGLHLVPEAGGPNPLAVPAALVRPKAHPLVKHRLISLTAAVAAVVLLSAGYVYQRDDWSAAADAAEHYDPDQNSERALRSRIRDYARPQGSDPLLDVLVPRYFDKGPGLVGCAFVERIRQGALEDQLLGQICRSATNPSDWLSARCSRTSQALPEAVPPEEILYVLALLYASRDNSLGSLIRSARQEWADVILSDEVIDDYLNLAGSNHDMRLLEELWSCRWDRPEGQVPDQAMALLDALGSDRMSALQVTRVATKAQELHDLMRDRRPFDHAADVLDSQDFQEEPLRSYLKVFSPYRPRLQVLQELGDNYKHLDQIIDIVGKGTAGADRQPPADVATLDERLRVLLEQKVKDQAKYALNIGSKGYEIDPARIATQLRDSNVRALIREFRDNALAPPPSVLGLNEQDAVAEEPLAVSWPSGLSGCRTLPRPYSRAGFEKVKLHLSELEKLLAQMDRFAPEREEITEIVSNAVTRYAGDYGVALDDCYGEFEMARAGSEGLKRVLRALSSDQSPMRDFVSEIAKNSTFATDNDHYGLFAPLQAVQAGYAAITRLADVGTPNAEMVKYRDILRDALVRLGSDASVTLAASPFTAGLSPAARLAFESLADPKSSLFEAAKKWIQQQKLDDDQARPFLEPLDALWKQAIAELGRSVGQLNRTLVSGLESELLSRYPFDPRASDDIQPDQLEEWLNPKRGRVMRDFVAGLEALVQPVSTYGGSRRWAAIDACGADAGCKHAMQPLIDTLNDLCPITALLWTDDGKPQPLRVRVVPHPLRRGGSGEPRPTAVRLVAGEGRVDYFNQKPVETVLELDWTKPQSSTLSVDLASKDPVKSFEPPELEVSDTPWSLLRLLQKGQCHGATCTWEIPTGDRSSTSITMTVRESATEAFQIRLASRHRLASADN